MNSLQRLRHRDLGSPRATASASLSKAASIAETLAERALIPWLGLACRMLSYIQALTSVARLLAPSLDSVARTIDHVSQAFNLLDRVEERFACNLDRGH